MALLPAGFALPPVPYLLGLVVGLALVTAGLWRVSPSVAPETVLGLAPWMILGSALHAGYVLGSAPAGLAPLFGAPAVYATVFVGLGTIWVGLSLVKPADPMAVARWLGGAGGVAFVGVAAGVLTAGPSPALGWPAVGLVGAGIVAAGTWLLLIRVAPAAAETGWPGGLVVFAHALDGVSTAIGVDVLGFGERTPLARTVLEVAAALPTAPAIGVGWLFVVVKLAVAGAVVSMFAGLLEEEPRQAYLLLAIIAAVGLGPGVHNLLLYAVAG